MSIKYYEKKIDLSEFIPIPRPENSRSLLAISISESGYITLNEQLLKNLKTKKLAILANPDYKTLLINDDDTGELQFPKNGRMKNDNLILELKKHKIPFPARYEFQYSKSQSLWVGFLVNPDKRLNSIGRTIKNLGDGNSLKKA